MPGTIFAGHLLFYLGSCAVTFIIVSCIFIQPIHAGTLTFILSTNDTFYIGVLFVFLKRNILLLTSRFIYLVIDDGEVLKKHIMATTKAAAKKTAAKKSASKKTPAKKTVAKKSADPCWDGYEQVGMKKKGGKEVPNCVPEKK